MRVGFFSQNERSRTSLDLSLKQAMALARVLHLTLKEGDLVVGSVHPDVLMQRIDEARATDSSQTFKEQLDILEKIAEESGNFIITWVG